MAATTHTVTHGNFSAASIVQGLSIPEHDKIELTYTGTQLTGVTYKKGNQTVAVLALTYNGSGLLSSVIRS